MRFNRYVLHKGLGLILLPLLIISCLTGFFRANHKWFWKEDYKKVKNHTFTRNLNQKVIPADSVFTVISRMHPDAPEIRFLNLTMKVGAPYYTVGLKGNNDMLIDARIGTVVSPLTPELATLIATEYVPDGFRVKNVLLDTLYRTRKEKHLKPVYTVEFNDPLHTRILISRDNGEIVEEIDDNLEFGFLMIRLHNFDFGGMKTMLMSVAGLGIFVLGLSGGYLWLRSIRRKPVTY